MKYLDGAKPTIEKLQELADYLNTTTDYLLYGSEESRSYEIENNNGNQFVKLPDGQFLMTMPIVSVEAQAGFLDFYGDVEYLAEMPKHSMVVDEVHRGHYIAFVVAGDSMDNYTPESFMAGDIVSTRESQRINWTDKLRIKDFPYWVIYTNQSAKPMLKQIINHDTERGVITCHSLNESPEYADFKLNIDDVIKLFYVIDKSRNISKKSYY